MTQACRFCPERPSSRPRWALFRRSGWALFRRSFPAVVWAFGHGDERCDLQNSPDFRGLHFWDSDRFEQDHSGCGTQHREGTVLISGSGDGAIQDFLRIVTRRRSVRSIFNELQLDTLGINLHSILSKEYCTEKAVNWSNGASFAAPYMEELQNLHSDIVGSIVNNAGLSGRITALVSRRPQSTVLITRQKHLTCSYPLNRFLALLIIQAVKAPTIEWKQGWEVQQVQSINMPPNPINSQNCLGHEWRVTLGDIQGAAASQDVDANVVLLRHGIDPPEVTLPPGPTLPRMPRPTPPIYLFKKPKPKP